MPQTYLRGDTSRPTGLYLMLSLPLREGGLPNPYDEKGFAVFFGPLEFVQGKHDGFILRAYAEDGVEYQFPLGKGLLSHEGTSYVEWAVIHLTPED